MRARAKRGRPSKLAMVSATEKAAFLALLRAGSPQSWACRHIRLSYQTLTNYRERAAAGEEPYAEFIREVEQAQAQFVVERLRVLDADATGAPLLGGRERGNGDIKWILERLHPKDFALTTRAEVTGKDGAPLVPGGVTPQAAASLVRATFGDAARQALKPDQPTEENADD